MLAPQIAALYCRISKNNHLHDENNSIAHQKALLQKTAAQYGFEHTRFFIDNGVSGTTFDRPALKRLVDAIQADQICAVLVKDISRLGRDYLKVGYYLEQFFPQHHVRFIAVSGGIDSNNNSTDFLPLYSVMDEWYAKDVSRKMRLMYQSRAAAGIPIGIPIYGYMKAPDHSKAWIPDREAAAVVQRIYQLAFRGYGPEQIAGILESDRILTPNHYRIAQGGKRKSRALMPYHWGTSIIA